MTRVRVGIVDFGAGNLRSIYNAVSSICGKENVDVIEGVGGLSDCSHIIMPGVGAFDRAMENLLAKDGLVAELEEEVLRKGKPFFGICIGMQILTEEGFENRRVKGLGWLKGKVKKFPYNSELGLKVPHMGWNSLVFNNNFSYKEQFLGKDFYFVHSYFVSEPDANQVLAECEYITRFPAIIGRDNIVASQFHPEKSGEVGKALLRNFLQS